MIVWGPPVVIVFASFLQALLEAHDGQEQQHLGWPAGPACSSSWPWAPLVSLASCRRLPHHQQCSVLDQLKQHKKMQFGWLKPR